MEMDQDNAQWWRFCKRGNEIFEVFRGGEDSSRGLLDCDAVQCCGRIPTFRRTVLRYNPKEFDGNETLGSIKAENLFNLVN
jgi:hypothetical protein